MMRNDSMPALRAALLALTASLAACGGGGGSSSAGAAGVPPTSAPSQSPGATGAMKIGGNAMANATVAFTCGCTQQAGQVIADAGGSYTIAIPSAVFGGGSGTYTPPGHNLMVIGYASGSRAQAYTMEFLGTVPSHNLNLDGNSNLNVADQFTTAAALYIYYETIQYYAAHPSSDNTYDIWNFNNVVSFKQSLAGGANAAEQKLIADVVAAQAGGTSLYPAVPSWDKTSGDAANSQIVADIKAVASSGDPAIPQPCGSSCSGPTP